MSYNATMLTHPGEAALFRVWDVDELVADGLLEELREGGRELLSDDVVVRADDDDGAVGRPSLHHGSEELCKKITHLITNLDDILQAC